MSKSLNFVVSIKLDRRSSDANGNHPIKLRVWNRASKVAKMYSCNKFSDEITFERIINQKITVKGDTHKLRLYLDRILSNANEILESHQVSSFHEFENLFFGKTGNSLDLIYFIDQKIKECKDNQQYSSKEIYRGLRNLIVDFSGRNFIELDIITIKWLKSLEKWYLNRKKGNGTSYKISGYSIYIRHLRIILNELVYQELISEKDYPFGRNKYTIPAAENNKRPLSSEDIS